MAIYLTCMEARHPKTLQEMNIKNDLFNILDDINLKYPGTKDQLLEMVTELHNMPTIGPLLLAAIITNEFTGKFITPISQELENAFVKEYNFEEEALLSSNYPIARFGNYRNDFSLSIALSPKKAIVYATDSTFFYQFQKFPESIKINILNFLTLSNATEAYAKNDNYHRLVNNYLGWATPLNDNQKREFLGKFIKTLV